MQDFLLVTGSQHKLTEWKHHFPHIQNVDLDLFEIQSDNPEEVVSKKVKRAFRLIRKPVVVDDVSAGLTKFGGLPGTFIKFFLKELGNDALLQMAGQPGEPASITCSIAYYDGTRLITSRADVHGTIVEPRGNHGFGIDRTFLPVGSTKTFGEMTLEEKSQKSHRTLAIQRFIQALDS